MIPYDPTPFDKAFIGAIAFVVIGAVALAAYVFVTLLAEHPLVAVLIVGVPAAVYTLGHVIVEHGRDAYHRARRWVR